MQDPVVIRLRHGALYGLPMPLVAACWAACYASSAAGLIAAMHGASLSTRASLLRTLPVNQTCHVSQDLTSPRLSKQNCMLLVCKPPKKGCMRVTVTPYHKIIGLVCCAASC